MTETEIKRLNKGARIRPIDGVKCHSIYKKGGLLIFQPPEECKGNEFTYGIEVAKGYCFEFKANELEKIPNKVNTIKKRFVSLVRLTL